ncbi:MAG: N-acetyltransferase [Bauldia sp.]|nr:N-acetyltransferase [Bauldia sp.]
MPDAPFSIRRETPADAAAVAALNDTVFGPGRFVRAAYRLREGVAPDLALSVVAELGGRVVGSVRMTPIRIGDHPAHLLGPLVVEPAHQNRGGGRSLVAAAVGNARAAGHGLILLVGDEPYYGPLGFRRVSTKDIVMPGPVDPQRLLVAELRAGAAEGLAGVVARAL